MLSPSFWVEVFDTLMELLEHGYVVLRGWSMLEVYTVELAFTVMTKKAGYKGLTVIRVAVNQDRYMSHLPAAIQSGWCSFVPSQIMQGTASLKGIIVVLNSSSES